MKWIDQNHSPAHLFFWLVIACVPIPAESKTAEAIRPLLTYSEHSVTQVLGSDTLFLDQATPIEKFLKGLDGFMPLWKKIYGPQGEGHMPRLFNLNHVRNQARLGKDELGQLVAFVWEGILSSYVPDSKGFRVAIGPKIIPTSWGDVRFKPYQLPSNLIARPDSKRSAGLIRDQKRGKTIDVHLILSGRLIQEESIIYDFAHEEPGKGMVMPVVKIEQVDIFLVGE